MAEGFKDLSTDAELLAGPAAPKALKAKMKRLISPKLLQKFQAGKALLQKATATTGAALSTVSTAATIAGQVTAVVPAADAIAKAGQRVLRGAALASMANTARNAQAAVLSRTGLGGAKNALRSLTAVAGAASLGVSIIKEVNPKKLRRPFILPSGAAVNPSLAGRPLAETVAKGLTVGLMVAPLAKGVASFARVFKTDDEVQQSPRYFSLERAIAGTLGEDLEAGSTATASLSASIRSQQGLLPDEIFYRLVLLAENLYQPLNARSGNQLRVLEGFRSEHTRTSAHERGEAIDVTVGDGSLSVTPTLFALAQWARDRLVYDQIILCHSAVPAPQGQAWLHLSFSPDARRRQVLTKTFNDEFVDGLHVYTAYDLSSSVYTRDKERLNENMQLAYQYLNTIADREQRLNPVGVNTSESFNVVASGEGKECQTLVDPMGRPYDKTQVPVSQDELRRLFDETVAEFPDLWAEVKEPGDRRTKTGFMRAYVAKINNPRVGIVGVRGNASDRSIDALAILNPTAGPQGRGDDRWDEDKRMMVVDVILASQSEDARWGWVDHTCLDDTAINPVFIPD